MDRYDQAQNPRTPAETLEELAGDEDEWVRQGVAYNPSTPTKVLTRLAGDLHEEVRRGVAQNPSVPTGLLPRLLRDWEQLVYEAAAGAALGRLTELPEDLALWLRLWELADEEGREQIQKHPYGRKVAVMTGLS